MHEVTVNFIYKMKEIYFLKYCYLHQELIIIFIFVDFRFHFSLILRFYALNVVDELDVKSASLDKH